EGCMSLRSSFCSVLGLCGALVCASANAAIPAAEHDALVALYNATGGAQWTSNTGWNGAAGSECDWYGVHCDETDSTVLQIDLSNNHLVGTLPSLAAFTNLQRLVVSANSLSGNLPALSALKALQFIDVNTNQFSGQMPSLSG